MSDFSLEFDMPSKEQDSKHYSFANKLSKEEKELFNTIDNNPKPLDKHLNPFKKEMKVVVLDNRPERLKHALGPLNSSIATIAAVLNRDYVNINFWDVYPNVIKNIHISQIKLIEKETLLNKVKYKLVKFLRLFIK